MWLILAKNTLNNLEAWGTTLSVHCNKNAKSSWFLTRLDIEKQKKHGEENPHPGKSHLSNLQLGVMVNIPLTPN